MNLKLLQILPLDISKKIMAISIQNLKDRLIYQNTHDLYYTLYHRIDGFQPNLYHLYHLYADKKEIIYYLERLKHLDAITIYIRAITTEWLYLVYYIDFDYYENLEEDQVQNRIENDIDVSIIQSICEI